MNWNSRNKRVSLMTDQTEALAHIYSYILSAEWGAKDTLNEEADRQCFGNIAGDRLVVEDQRGRPSIEVSIADSLGGSQQPCYPPRKEGLGIGLAPPMVNDD